MSAVVLERAKLRLAEAGAMLADAVARHKAAERAKYRDYRRRRGERRGRVRARPPQAGYRSGP